MDENSYDFKTGIMIMPQPSQSKNKNSICKKPAEKFVFRRLFIYSKQV